MSKVANYGLIIITYIWVNIDIVKPINMVIRGKKRGKDQNDMDMSMVNEVLWTPQSSDPQAYAIDAASILGVFMGANMDAINSLNTKFDKQKAEIISLKEALEQLKKQHEDKQDELQLKNVTLSVEYREKRMIMPIWFKRLEY